MTYDFRPLVAGDRALFDDWLGQPHMGGWWGDSPSEWAIIKLEQAMKPSPTDMRVVEKDGVPFAYIQNYNAHAFEAPHYVDLAQSTQAIDTFLGDPNFLGEGHAQGYLRQRAQELIESGAELVVVDPDVKNTRAIATYRAAGFDGDQMAICEDGTRVLILTFPAKT